nr:SR-related and CTD-associated factor 4-like isoform X3 [Vicugna pacos]
MCPSGTGKPPLATTLEDISVRTLYDKLEDQSLHVAAQLSKHRDDMLAFYRGACRQLQGLKDLLQGFSMTEQPGLGSSGDPATGAGAAARTDDGQSKDSWGSHTVASPREPWQCPPGCTLSVPPAGFQPELDRVLYALASALSQASGPQAWISRKASGQVGEQPLSARQRDPQLVGEVLLKPRPLPSDEKHQGPSPQQQSGPGRLPQGDAKGTDAESRGRGRRTGAFPGLQVGPGLCDGSRSRQGCSGPPRAPSPALRSVPSSCATTQPCLLPAHRGVTLGDRSQTHVWGRGDWEGYFSHFHPCLTQFLP